MTAQFHLHISELFHWATPTRPGTLELERGTANGNEAMAKRRVGFNMDSNKLRFEEEVFFLHAAHPPGCRAERNSEPDPSFSPITAGAQALITSDINTN